MVFKVTFQKYNYYYDEEGSHFSIYFSKDSIRELITEAEVYLVENHLEPNYYISNIRFAIAKIFPYGKKYQLMVQKKDPRNIHTDFIPVDMYIKNLKDAKLLKKSVDNALKASGDSKDWETIII